MQIKQEFLDIVQAGDKKAALRMYKGTIKNKKVGGVVDTILQKEKELKGEAKQPHQDLNQETK